MARLYFFYDCRQGANCVSQLGANCVSQLEQDLHKSYTGDGDG